MATLIRVDGTREQVSAAVDDKFTFDELQGFVGGWIERTFTINGLEMYVNEEGKLMGLPLNLTATLLHRGGFADPIVGDALILTLEEAEKQQGDSDD